MAYQNTRGSFELEEHHSHFVMVEGDGAVSFRERLERHISSNDISGDQIQTPKMLLVISGDAHVFEWVLKALDKDDPSTGTSVPVLVLGDSGGAAQDIWEYWGGSWDAPARKLPEVDGRLRDANYVKVATELLPRILEYGMDTGNNSTRQLDFFTLSRDLELKEPLSFAIQKAMMNDCPDVNEEALLSVVWGEPAFLQLKLEEVRTRHMYQTQPFAPPHAHLPPPHSLCSLLAHAHRRRERSSTCASAPPSRPRRRRPRVRICCSSR